MLALGTLALRHDAGAASPLVTIVSLDELELQLRHLAGVVAVGFVETDDLVVVEVQAGPDAYDDLARDATVLAAEHVRRRGRGRGRAVG